MTNIYDKAQELAGALKDTDEIIKLREASKKIENNENHKKMISDFRKIQMEAYTEQVTTGNITNETQEKLQNIGSIISLNPEVAEYMQAEARFSIMWDDVIKILNEGIGVDLTLGMI